MNYLMTLYLCPDVDPHDLAKNAKASHVVGVGHASAFSTTDTARAALLLPSSCWNRLHHT